MMKNRVYPTFLLALMGSMDCFTTVIGILYFGAVECNPLIAGIVSSNLAAFVAVKLTTTAFVCIIFIQTEKILMHAKDKTGKEYSRMQKLLKATHAGIIAFLFIVVANNLLVLANAF